MSVDELARRRAVNTRHLAGARRRQPPPEVAPGDIGVIAEDLRTIKGMTEEILAEALVLGDNDLVAAIGALILHVSDVAATVERMEGGD